MNAPTPNRDALAALMDSYKKLIQHCYDALAPDFDPKMREQLRDSIGQFIAEQ